MVVYVCRQDCVFDGLVPRRCVVGVGGLWRVHGIYLWSGRVVWLGVLCVVCLRCQTLCVVVDGMCGGFCRCVWLFQMSLYSMGGYHSLRQCRFLVSAHSCYAFFSWLSCHYEPRAVFLTFQGVAKKGRCAAVLLVL